MSAEAQLQNREIPFKPEPPMFIDVLVSSFDFDVTAAVASTTELRVRLANGDCRFWRGSSLTLINPVTLVIPVSPQCPLGATKFSITVHYIFRAGGADADADGQAQVQPFLGLATDGPLPAQPVNVFVVPEFGKELDS